MLFRSHRLKQIVFVKIKEREKEKRNGVVPFWVFEKNFFAFFFFFFGFGFLFFLFFIFNVI